MPDIRRKMKDAWNARAEKDAYFYVETRFWNNDRPAFFALGEERAALLIDPLLDERGVDGAGKTAIDLGCGVGRFTQALARRFDRVVGLDVSESMVAQAREAAVAFRNLVFMAGDGITLPVADKEADFIWSYEVFQHMPSYTVIRRTLKEISRVLRPAGIGLLHFRTAQAYPRLLWHIARLAPTPLMRAAKRALGKDPETADDSWRGARPLTRAKIEAFCLTAGLRVIMFRDDPTHEPGSRVFAVVERAAP
jgi:SAM-dependent methyltransferase